MWLITSLGCPGEKEAAVHSHFLSPAAVCHFVLATHTRASLVSRGVIYWRAMIKRGLVQQPPALFSLARAGRLVLAVQRQSKVCLRFEDSITPRCNHNTHWRRRESTDSALIKASFLLISPVTHKTGFAIGECTSCTFWMKVGFTHHGYF